MRATAPTEVWVTVCVTVCVAGAIGCGHPASDKECQEIVERIATLELEKANSSTDPKSVGAQVDETKKALAPNTMKDCVGKRITERAMQCVRSAKSSQQIVDDCFK
jgi:hypothetical protein